MAERAIGENSLLSLKELDEAFSGLYVKLHDGLEYIHSSRQGALIILFGVGRRQEPVVVRREIGAAFGALIEGSHMSFLTSYHGPTPSHG